MRKYFIIACLFFSTLQSCDKFLDVKPKGKDIAYLTVHYNGLLNNLVLEQFSHNYMYMTDELMSTPEYITKISLVSQKAFKWEGDIFLPTDLCSEWEKAYSSIYVYNTVVNGVLNSQEGTLQEKEAIHAEARVMRAYMYQWLLNFFAKPYNAATANVDPAVPLVTETNITETGRSRATVKEVYDFILKEFSEACPRLSPITRSQMRVYKSAGYALWGKSLLNAGNYSEALVALRTSVAALQGSANTIRLFDYNTELGLNRTQPWLNGGKVPTPTDPANVETIFARTQTIASMISSPLGVFVKPEIYNLFEANDFRRLLFANRNNTQSITYPSYKRVTPTQVNIGITYPDLLLMLAECEARAGDLSKAKSLLEQLRQNRMPAASAAVTVSDKDGLIRLAITERRREFMHMGFRWFDMRRLWNDPLFQDHKADYFKTDGTSTYQLTEQRLVYKIPPKILSFNPGWTDNP
jgi:hypothetical protein